MLNGRDARFATDSGFGTRAVMRVDCAGAESIETTAHVERHNHRAAK